MIKFYIIYSIDIPKEESEYWDYTTKELFDLINAEKLIMPFDFEGFSDEELKENNTDELFEINYSDCRLEMINLLEEHFNNSYGNQILNQNLSYYFRDNIDKFRVTEEDNNSDEYSYCDLTTIHRKYVGELNEEEFLDFIRDYEYSSTCNTMGSLTEYGWLPAFSVELSDNDNIECLYVSLLFDEKLDDEIMEIIENQIREAIEEGDVSEEMFKINK